MHACEDLDEYNTTITIFTNPALKSAAAPTIGRASLWVPSLENPLMLAHENTHSGSG